MEIKNVSVIGAGTMGNGIAQVFAASGFDVTMIDIKDEFLVMLPLIYRIDKSAQQRSN